MLSWRGGEGLQVVRHKSDENPYCVCMIPIKNSQQNNVNGGGALIIVRRMGVRGRCAVFHGVEGGGRVFRP